MDSVFAYKDYRKFLQDHYHTRKKDNRSYSFRFFARKAGLDSPNYYKLVMDGQRNLTHKNVKNFSKGLGLKEHEALYFENLVFFNQAQKKDEKELFARNLEALKSGEDRGLLSKDQYEILTQWYPLVIKELALIESFYDKPKWIAAKLDYKITPEQAKEAVLLLERLGLVRIHSKTKRITVTQQSLQTPDVIHSQVVKKYHLQMIEKAKEALNEQSSEERCFSALTVAVNLEDLPLAFKKIHEFRNQMDSLFSKNKKYNSIYQLNINLFRMDTDV